MSIVPCHMKMENPLAPFEQKFFVCVVDNKVVGNIVNFNTNNQNNELMTVFMPEWETFVNILKSPNHQFIENSTSVVIGTIWDGQQFIAPIIYEESSIFTAENDTGVYIKVNNSYIYYENDIWISVKDYTLYIIELLCEYLKQNSSLEVNIIVNGTKKTDFNNSNKIVSILNILQVL